MKLAFRTRLALANAAILAVTMLLIAWLSVLSLQSGINATIDRMLALRVRLFVGNGPAAVPFGAGPPPFLMEGAADFDQLPPFIRSRILGRLEQGGPGFGPPAGAAGLEGRPSIRLTDMTGEGAPPPWDVQSVREALAGKRSFTTVHQDGVHFRVHTAPRHRDGVLVGTVQTARALTDFDGVYREHAVRVLALFPVGVGLALLAGFFLANRALGPVRKVTRAAAEIGAGDLNMRLTVQGTDELAELARTFNGMIGRLGAAFEQQRQFTADASHELRTPLARMKLTLSEALSQGATREELQEALRVADAAADRLGAMASDLLILTRSDSGQLPLRLRRMDVAALVRDAVALWEDGGPEFKIELPTTPLFVEADPAHLHRALENVLQNAVRHTPREGMITVSAHATDSSVVMSIRDTGEGIPAECLAQVCDRFFQVEAARSPGDGGAATPPDGSGLGLAIVRSLVEAHGGTLELYSELGRGTDVLIILPVEPPDTLTIS